ncbi:MAG TPA: ABC transporter substrate-binding protein [Chloroflexota bacterium]|nr:ABC transporter substrate-binding protein [Chloroflexota bacterium]
MSPDRSGDPTRSETRKSLTIAALASYKGFGPQFVTTTGGGSRQLNEIHSVGLLTTDLEGSVIPRLASDLPTVSGGDVVLMPDGRMQTTFHLRRDVTWQDGAPFTADDIVFGWQVATDPQLDVRITPTLRQIDTVEALSSDAVRITWKSPYFHAISFSINEFWPLPRHLLGEAFTGDPEAFMRLPYWNTDYVHLGPFRLVDFGLGENLLFQRSDGYFLGRPKLDEIRIRIVPDSNVVYAALVAGAVDLVGEGVLATDVALQLRDEWAKSREGTVISKQGNLFFVHVQFNPDYQRIPELRENVAVRRALLQAVDRDALRESILPGVAGTEPTTLMTAGDPRARAAGTPFARYIYSPRAALEQLATVGWRRDPDGKLVNQRGEPITLPLRSGSSGNEPRIIAQDWREFGFQVEEEVVPGSLLFDRAYRVSFPGLEYSAQGNNEGILSRFDSRNCARPPRYQGAPDGCYENPQYDALVDKLSGTLEPEAQGQVLREIGEFLAEELPLMPMIYQVTFAAVRANVHALTDDFLGANDTGPGQESRNAHLWDRMD